MTHFVFNELHVDLACLSFIIIGNRLIDQDSFKYFGVLDSQQVYGCLLAGGLLGLHIQCQDVFTVDGHYHQVMN